MPAIHSALDLFEIEAADREPREPEDESYVIHMRLQGTYEVRRFLSDNGVDERQIALAIEELSRSRQVKVASRS